MSSPFPDPRPIIPSPQAVRTRLAQILREARLLRSQLRLSRRASEEEQRTAGDRREVAHAE